MATVKLSAKVGDRTHEIAITRVDAAYVVTLDGVEHVLDVRKLEADFYSILYEGKSYELSVESSGGSYWVRHGAHEQLVELSDASRGGREELRRRDGPERIDSIMPGKVVRVLVEAGDEVRAGQGIVVIEAMKMENEVAAPRGGRVKEIAVAPGETVEAGAKLVVLE
ncbi:MAG TPA: biotin/lipoyl-containing protein [Candidatus Polarisedimenticolaceae bacterium]|nr:biotin/lipoyl-containing protein [Candidatus Polarisedimenticolaceae bacterium]